MLMFVRVAVAVTDYVRIHETRISQVAEANHSLDIVEENSSAIHILNELLTTGRFY